MSETCITSQCCHQNVYEASVINQGYTGWKESEPVSAVQDCVSRFVSAKQVYIFKVTSGQYLCLWRLKQLF